MDGVVTVGAGQAKALPPNSYLERLGGAEGDRTLDL
jgi:hypothetical protein